MYMAARQTLNPGARRRGENDPASPGWARERPCAGTYAPLSLRALCANAVLREVCASVRGPAGGATTEPVALDARQRGEVRRVLARAEVPANVRDILAAQWRRYCAMHPLTGIPRVDVVLGDHD